MEERNNGKWHLFNGNPFHLRSIDLLLKIAEHILNGSCRMLGAMPSNFTFSLSSAGNYNYSTPQKKLTHLVVKQLITFE